MSDYTDIQPELDDFENAVYGKEVRDSMVSAIKKIHDIAESAADAPDATTATAGQAPIADGQGGWQWGDVATSGDSVPTNVRQAILALLQNGVYTRDDMSDKVAVIQSWATEITAISVSPTTLSINGMNQRTIVATTTPAGGVITWASSDPTVATVSGGVVTPTGVNGSCVITASCGGKSATCAVTVSGFATLLSIDAVYTQSGTVYDTDTLDSLKSDLVVTGTYDDSRTLPITDYVLSGTLAEGTSVITVTYGGKTTTFNVSVSKNLHFEILYNTAEGQSSVDQRAYILQDAANSVTKQRVVLVSTVGTHVIQKKHNDNTESYSDTIYYPAFMIPVGATSFTFSHTYSSDLYCGSYVVRYDETIGTWVKVYHYTWDTINSWTHDVSAYNDGTYAMMVVFKDSRSSPSIQNLTLDDLSLTFSTQEGIDPPDDYTWLYESKNGTLLKNDSHIAYASSGTITEEITGNLLHIANTGNQANSQYKFTDTTTTDAKMTFRAQIVSTSVVTSNRRCIAVTLSDGSMGAISNIFERDGTIRAVTWLGSTDSDQTEYDSQIPATGFHIFELSLHNGVQSLKIDGNTVFSTDQLSGFYTTMNRFMIQNTGESQASIYLQWLAYKEYS